MGNSSEKMGTPSTIWRFRSLGTSTRCNDAGVRPSIWPWRLQNESPSQTERHISEIHHTVIQKRQKWHSLRLLDFHYPPFLAVFLSPSSRLHCCPQPCEDVYASAMEVNFWGSSTCSSASWDATQKQWLVTWCCEATCQLAVRLGYNCMQQNKQ